MTIIKENLDIHKLISEYVEHLYNECPNSFVVAKDGIEMTVTDWCHHFGGTPKGKTNYEFLNAQFEKGNALNSYGNEDNRGCDD
ncbi:hypothetical protein N8559_01465 [Gammaproteobacteria bacterium]|nr:hypothetical protein [Gammaproteobacteria bacterium]